jgi:hypothetical protein
VLFLAAVDKLARSTRHDAESCLERHDAAGDLDATGLGALAFLYHLDYDDGADLIDATLPGKDDAYETARRAIEADKQDLLARMAMTFSQIARNELDNAKDSMEALISLNPPTSTLGIAALLMTKLGDSAAGMRYYYAASSQSGRPTASLFVAPTVLSVQQGNYAGALKHADLMDSPDFTMFQVFLAALNAYLDQPDQAEARAADIRRMHPQFSSYGKELIDRWALPADVTEKLVFGLERAGISLD